MSVYLIESQLDITSKMLKMFLGDYEPYKFPLELSWSERRITGGGREEWWGEVRVVAFNWFETPLEQMTCLIRCHQFRSLKNRVDFTEQQTSTGKYFPRWKYNKYTVSDTMMILNIFYHFLAEGISNINFIF